MEHAKDFSNVNKPRHILSANQFDRGFLDYLYVLTNTIRRFDKSKEGLLYLQSLLPHARAMLYFTQPSTRTFLSFNTAASIVGMRGCEIRDKSTSSELKGESIEHSRRRPVSHSGYLVAD